MNTYMKGTVGLVTLGTCMALVWGCTSDSLCCVGGASTGKTVLVGPLTTEAVANGSDLKKGMTYYIDEPLYVESRVTNGLYLCRCGEKATCINLLSGVCEDVERRRRVAVTSVRDYVDDDAISGPLLVYDGVFNFQDRAGTHSARLFRELALEEQSELIEAYRKMKQKKDKEAEAGSAELREKAKKAFSGINVDPRGRIHVDRHFRDFVGLGVDRNTDKIVKAVADGDVETLMGLRGGRYSKKEEKIRYVSESQISYTEDWLKGLNRSVELEWLGDERSMPTYAIFRVTNELDLKAGKYERGGFGNSVLMDSEVVNAYVFCKGRRNPDRKYESEEYSRNLRIKNCKENIAFAEWDRIRSNEWIGRQEKELLQIETAATQEVARLQMRLAECEKGKSKAEEELKTCRDKIVKLESDSQSAKLEWKNLEAKFDEESDGRRRQMEECRRKINELRRENKQTEIEKEESALSGLRQAESEASRSRREERNRVEKLSREGESELSRCKFTENNCNTSLISYKRDIESLKAMIVSRKERQAEDVKRKKEQIAATIKERDEKAQKIEGLEKVIAQIEKDMAEAEAKRIEAERVPGTYTASWTNGFHRAQMAVMSSDERIRGFRVEHNQKKITSEQLQEKVRNERRALNATLLKIAEEM